MTETEFGILAAKIDGLADGIALWRKSSCEEHARRLEIVEDRVQQQGEKIASGGRIALAAFLGALIPAMAVGVAVVELVRKAAAAHGGG